MMVTYDKNPILAASWMGVNSRKLSRVGSAPASSSILMDSFFCASTAQCKAVSPSVSYAKTSLHMNVYAHTCIIYLTSPEPSKTCNYLFILHPILKTLTPLEILATFLLRWHPSLNMKPYHSKVSCMSHKESMYMYIPVGVMPSAAMFCQVFSENP